MTRRTKIKFNDTEHAILSVYLDHPFATYQEVAKRTDYNVSYVGKIMYDIRTRLTQRTTHSRLHVFYALRWIRPTTDIDHLWRSGRYELSSENIETLLYLADNPTASLQDIADNLYVVRGTARARLRSLYRAFGLTNKSNPRLRMYSILGWYCPALDEGARVS